jgi:heterodisulfide reductase subunit A-like polyferredoxin
MKCMICGTTKEPTEIETGFTDPKKAAAAAAEAAAQAEELSRWEHLRVTITRDGGQLELVAGDICPNEKLQAGDVVVARSK